MFQNENTDISNLITGKHVNYVRDRQANKAVDPKGMVQEAGNAPGTATKDPDEPKPEPMLGMTITQKAEAFTRAGHPPDMMSVREHPEWAQDKPDLEQDKTADAKGPESSV